MCIRDRGEAALLRDRLEVPQVSELHGLFRPKGINRDPYSLGLRLYVQAILRPIVQSGCKKYESGKHSLCLLYTSDAADEL